MLQSLADQIGKKPIVYFRQSTSAICYFGPILLIQQVPILSFFHEKREEDDGLTLQNCSLQIQFIMALQKSK